MKTVTIHAKQEIFIDGHTYVEGDEIENVAQRLAEKLTKAGKAEVVAGEKCLNSLSGAHTDPVDLETNADGLRYEDQAINDAQPHPENLEMATMNRPNKTNGKPRAPKVD